MRVAPYNRGMGVVRVVAWAAVSVYATIPLYWITTHGWIGHWRRHGSAGRAFRPLVLLWVIYIAAATAVTARWRHDVMLLPNLRWARLLIALVCWIPAWLIYRRIREFGFGRFVGRVELQADTKPSTPERAPASSAQDTGAAQRLVTGGMHAYVRHPIYLGHLLTACGWVIAGGSVACLALLAFALATGAVMLQMEEGELVSRFGDEYRAYRARTPLIVPRSMRVFRGGG